MTDPELPLLTEPARPVGPVVTTAEQLAETAELLRADAALPIGIDTERAHGYRYFSRAYLIQLRTANGPARLVDPIAFNDTELEPLREVLNRREWILHAASQDLPCLLERDLRPTRVWDTEMGGRLLGLPRVGMASLAEVYGGVRLKKEHSAADWSRRPLPDSWLAYAALDVELLHTFLAQEADALTSAGKAEWWAQECQYELDVAVPPRQLPGPDDWRRTSGMHQLRKPRQLAAVRELWLARDAIARKLDRSPSKILPDRAISAAAEHLSLTGLAAYENRGAKRWRTNWEAALAKARDLSTSQLPPVHVPNPGPPHHRNWERRAPRAAHRLEVAKAALTELSEQIEVPQENILAPDLLRQLMWKPPEDLAVGLAQLNARPWQIELTTELLASAVLAGERSGLPEVVRSRRGRSS
ncbi:HRDC domain-containing protein [Parenemella sanctibonifatiensis]|uniref:Ribonuclease D n=1 Tax=Parenemella sanctibonifatiensis TaxID=2016505 RepID=A0A255E631_9ACTN|nr:HRDC domain-containing protein [Parenemella sanctibonifatiensis]OYN86411.1 ribonuclease D [Parenemella sanctibonifatiensis]